MDQEVESETWQNVDYMPIPNTVRTVVTSRVPTSDPKLIAGAWTFTFNDKQEILMTQLRIRGWDLPGGKVEPEERQSSTSVDTLAMATAIRETFEETKVTPKIVKLVGFRHFHSSGTPPENPKFPFPDCYFLYYYAQVDQMHEFVPEPQPNGAIGRGFLAEADALKEPKIQMHKDLYLRALAWAKNPQ